MRWSNVPLPEPHLAAIAAAAGLHFLVPLRLPVGRRTGSMLGAPMLVAGIGLAAWAVASANEADVESDSELLTTGAYALTQHPMYVGWAIGGLGLAVGTGSAWLVAGWLVAVAALDREIDAEESRLRNRFGATYSAYHDRVPRYLPAAQFTTEELSRSTARLTAWISSHISSASTPASAHRSWASRSPFGSESSMVAGSRWPSSAASRRSASGPRRAPR